MQIVCHLNDLRGLDRPRGTGRAELNILWLEEIEDPLHLAEVQVELNHRAWHTVKLWTGSTPWPTWRNRSHAFYLWISNSAQHVSLKTPPSAHYLCLNNSPKPHRLAMVRGLWARGLLPRSLVSFKTLGEFEPWHKGVVEWLGQPEGPKGILPVLPVPIVEMNRTAMSLVTESYVDKFDISEKTFQCLALGQPFVSFGCQGLHRRLFDWGFRPLPDWDYEFDSEPNSDIRMKMLLDQLETWSVYEPAKIKQHWRKTTELNRLHYHRLVRELRYPFDTKTATLAPTAKRQFKELRQLQKLSL